MGANSKIQWTHHTFNPWRGCQKIAAGCAHCYADDLSARNPGVLGVFGPEDKGGRRVVASEAMWSKPLLWDRWARVGVLDGDENTHIEPYRGRVFCASMADAFEDWQGPMMAPGKQPLILGPNFLASSGTRLMMGHVRERLFRLIDATPNLDWLILTKRPENVRRMWPGSECRQNVWLGTSIATQKDANANVPTLLSLRGLAAVVFLSVEPLIARVDLHEAGATHCDERQGVDWVIAGGESGPQARPCRLDWLRLVIDRCREWDCGPAIPCFVKQLGSHVVGCLKERLEMMGEESDADALVRWKLRDSKGGDPAEWPEDLRVREFPRVEVVT